MPFILFCLLVPGLVNERSHTILSVFDEDAIEHTLSAKIWLYGFNSVFCQVLIKLLIVVICCFLLHKKLKKDSS